MVLVAAASDHRHRRAAKSSRQDTPVTPSTLNIPAAKPSSAGAGLLGFSFSWGAQRRLRCSKDGAPAYASPSASPSRPSQHPHTPSPDKEEKPTKPLPQGDGAGTGSSSRPQRPRNLRPLRYAAASRQDGALQTPSTPAPRKRGFAVALTREQIARDFAAMRRCRCPSATRTEPPARRRGKKRPKSVQEAIDKMCPGLLLLDVDLDNYKIEERGLKR